MKPTTCRPVLAAILALMGLCFPHGLLRPAFARPPAALAAGGYEAVHNESGAQATYTCKGGDLVVNGEKNVLRIEGAVGALIINGDSNTVVVDAALGSVVLNGTGNKVLYSKERCSRAPEVVSNGNSNSVVPSK